MTTFRWISDPGLHWREEGDPDGVPVLFSNSLGTDMRLWDSILPLLPAGLRIIRYDKRGHGLSAAPDGDYAMGALVADAERVLEAAGATGAVIVGCSVGGMTAQGLAAKRPDLLRAAVLSNTAAKIGTREMWDERIRTVHEKGLAVMAPAIMERWFSKAFRESDAVHPWRRMVETTTPEGYAGVSAAISGTDFHSVVQDIRIPVLAVAGSEDGSTPPDLVRETADLIPGARFEIVRGAGHLPMVEKPEVFAGALTDFLRDSGIV